MVEKKSSNQFTVKWKEEDKPLREDFEKEKEKQKSNMKAFRVKLKENIDMKKAISELKKENEGLKEYVTYLNDVKKPLNVIFPQCNFSYLIEGELSKRECSLNNVDRGFNLPKEHGKFIVDDPQKCERCKAGLYKRFRKKHVAPKPLQSKPDSPITQRKCPMYDGAYVNLDICANCKRVTPKQYAECREQTLKNR
jgi:hypothetical protein